MSPAPQPSGNMSVHLNRRRLLLLAAGLLLLGAALLSFIGEWTGNQGLWTLGGTVGMARWTILCFAICGVGFLAAGWNGETDKVRVLEQRLAALERGEPFRPAP